MGVRGIARLLRLSYFEEGEKAQVLELKRAKDEARKRYEEALNKLEQEFRREAEKRGIDEKDRRHAEAIADLMMELEDKFQVDTYYQDYAEKAGRYIRAGLKLAKKEAKRVKPEAIPAIEEIEGILGTPNEIIYRDEIVKILDKLVSML